MKNPKIRKAILNINEKQNCRSQNSKVDVSQSLKEHRVIPNLVPDTIIKWTITPEEVQEIVRQQKERPAPPALR